MTTRSELLEWFYRRGRGARYQVILQKFGPDVEQALDGLIDLGMVFGYTQQKSREKKNQMFKVTARWSRNLELNQGQGGYRLRKSGSSSGGYSNGIKGYVKTAKGKYVLAHR